MITAFWLILHPLLRCFCDLSGRFFSFVITFNQRVSFVCSNLFYRAWKSAGDQPGRVPVSRSTETDECI